MASEKKNKKRKDKYEVKTGKEMKLEEKKERGKERRKNMGER